MDSTESDDDLEIADVVKRELGIDERRAKNQPKERLIGDDDPESDEAPWRRDRVTVSENERVEWSEEDSEGAYKEFKNRKTLKRKRAAASTRKAKAVEKSNGARNINKQADRHGGKEKKQPRVYGDESDDDALMEWNLPDYVQKRRMHFDQRTETLKLAGLKLPPDYQDIQFSDDERLESLKEKPNFPKAKASAEYKDVQLPYSLGLIPASIAQWIRHYQVQGTSFLHKLFVFQTGGILGDDMGLGKTVQVIAFLTAAFGKTGDERDIKRMRKMRRAGVAWYPRVLVVCPGTLIENWKAELQRWGWWHVDVYHGDTKESAIQAAITGRLEVMITTYTTYRMNKSAINMVEWDCVVADECHIIKGRTSETTLAMNEINALCRIGLTGTAIQNSYDELWTLLNWTNPGRFGPISTWKQSISLPLKIGQSHDATIYELSKARKTAKALVENLLPQFFLRRMKSLIADQLPKKSDRVIFCPLTSTQADAYENVLDSELVDLIKTSADECDCGSKRKRGWCCFTMNSDGKRWQSYVFPAISNLQKLANHLAILIPQGTDPKEKQDKDLEMLQIAVPDQWRTLYHNRDSILNYSNPEFCGKWKILKKLLRFWHANGDKVLVFSHSVRLLKMLQMLFNHTSYNVSYLDGAMSYENRAKTVDDFNSDPGQFVFLISTKAGGIGLNITSANKVVVVDPNWNPSYDLQAQDRAYRIGQIRDVEVFRLVSAGTIEEIVYARQIYKQQQANIGYTASMERRYFKGVQEIKEHKGEIFGLANLFAFKADNIVLREIVNKTNVAESKAGVAVVGLNLDDLDDNDDGDLGHLGGEDEDSAMSQLAALVAQGDAEAAAAEGNNEAGTSNSSKSRKPSKRPGFKKKSDPVQAILASAGVEYTHENSEVIGSSKVEAGLSRRAQEAGNDIDMAQQRLFATDSQQDQKKKSTTSSRKRREGVYDDDDDDDDDNNYDNDNNNEPNDIHDPYNNDENDNNNDNDSNAEPIWKYHPPHGVIKRQFCTMAHTFGFADATEFALVVEGWTQAQRRSCLDKFYKIRREKLALLARRGGDGG